MNRDELTQALIAVGCPPDKAAAMAAQLDKKARMDAERKGTSYDVALQRLVALMAQGWAAQRK
jgi:hypothetical protein